MKSVNKLTLTKNFILIIVTIVMVFLYMMFSGIRVSSASNARASIDTSGAGSLTITHYSVDNELVENVVSHIYLVATIDEDGQYTITDTFKGAFSDEDFFNNGYDYDAWKSCVMYDSATDSDDLLSFIKTNNIAETANGVSDSSGKTVYSNLTLGVYYVLSDRLSVDGYTYFFANFVYPVPILEKSTDAGGFEINYNPTVSPKKSKTANTEVAHCHILKRWNDSGYESNRPAYVTFNIYCDGEFMEQVTLSAANNWYYEWNKEGLHTFTVEEVYAGSDYYGTITVYQDGHDAEFICTNTYTPPSADDSDTPGTTTDDTPDDSDDSNIPSLSDLPEVLGAVRDDVAAVLGARRLPQTGLLWWPLPILVIAGIVLIIKGIRKTREN